MACGHTPPHAEVKDQGDAKTHNLREIFNDWLTAYWTLLDPDIQFEYFHALKKSTPEEVRTLLVETCYPKEAP